MAANKKPRKKPRKKYRPKGVRLDTMAWVKQGLTPLSQVDGQALTLKIRNHDALDIARRGEADVTTMDALVSALNMTEALIFIRDELGKDWAAEITAGQDALYEMCCRGVKTGRFVFTGPELTAVNLAMDIHDAQIDQCTVADIEQAIALVNRLIRDKKTRRIVAA